MIALMTLPIITMIRYVVAATVVYGTAEGLRGALMIVMILFVPAGSFMVRVARHVKADAED